MLKEHSITPEPFDASVTRLGQGWRMSMPYGRLRLSYQNRFYWEWDGRSEVLIETLKKSLTRPDEALPLGDSATVQSRAMVVTIWGHNVRLDIENEAVWALFQVFRTPKGEGKSC